MTIGNLEVIDIGLPNESTGSDSLYLAFNKTKNNFAILANTASQYVNFTGNTGIGVNANATTGTVDITNTGVVSLTAGDGSIILSEPTPGNLVITASNTGNGGSGTVTSVGVTSSTLTVGNSPIISSGNITLNLTTVSPTIAGTYTYPTVTVDQYGRVTTIANANSVGTVTSVGITPGTGISVTNSPITTTGNITITNTGVTRVSAGSGIQVSSSNGNVTISTTPVAAVTSVGLTSSSLTVTGSPITGSGTLTVDLPTNITAAGNVLATSGLGYTTGAGGTVTQDTSRTTGVTINKISGSITLFSAAGTSSYTTFTVTNSTVAATDVIIVNQKSGTDKYEAFVTNVSAGSFNITFSDVSGTTTEQPVFNFAVIKAVAA